MRMTSGTSHDDDNEQDKGPNYINGDWSMEEDRWECTRFVKEQGRVREGNSVVNECTTAMITMIVMMENQRKKKLTKDID